MQQWTAGRHTEWAGEAVGWQRQPAAGAYHNMFLIKRLLSGKRAPRVCIGRIDDKTPDAVRVPESRRKQIVYAPDSVCQCVLVFVCAPNAFIAHIHINTCAWDVHGMFRYEHRSIQQIKILKTK